MAVGIFLSPSIHSLSDNAIGDKGAKAIADAIKTMVKVKTLK